MRLFHRNEQNKFDPNNIKFEIDPNVITKHTKGFTL